MTEKTISVNDVKLISGHTGILDSSIDLSGISHLVIDCNISRLSVSPSFDLKDVHHLTIQGDLIDLEMLDLKKVKELVVYNFASYSYLKSDEFSKIDFKEVEQVTLCYLETTTISVYIDAKILIPRFTYVGIGYRYTGGMRGMITHVYVKTKDLVIPDRLIDDKIVDRSLELEKKLERVVYDQAKKADKSSELEKKLESIERVVYGQVKKADKISELEKKLESIERVVYDQVKKADKSSENIERVVYDQDKNADKIYELKKLVKTVEGIINDHIKTNSLTVDRTIVSIQKLEKKINVMEKVYPDISKVPGKINSLADLVEKLESEVMREIQRKNESIEIIIEQLEEVNRKIESQYRDLDEMKLNLESRRNHQ